MNVSDAANELEVSEFEVFRKAYRSWYGCNAHPGEVEREFRRYMCDDTIPPYVRHFLRQPVVLEA